MRLEGAIETHLRALLELDHPHFGHLFEAARYALFSGGKRLRPLLLLSVLEAFNVPIEKGLDAAAALEMIHTYSLIHDDLPAMDDDDLRRGKPTVHKAFNEAHAILTGDFLLTYAFEVLAKSPYLDEKTRLSLISLLSEKAGAFGLIGGQVMDLLGKVDDFELIKSMHRFKTGALISTALQMGALIAGVSPEDASRLEKVGQSLGLGYQLIDDYLDDENLYPGDVDGKEMALELLGEAKKNLQALSHKAPLLEKLMDLSIIRSR